MRDIEVNVNVDELEDPSPGEMLDAIRETGVTFEELKEAHRALGTEAIRGIKEAIVSSYKARVWEPGDLVNGIDPLNHPNPDAREGIQRMRSQGGEILLIYKVDGGLEKLVYFQWHEPYISGMVPIADPPATASRMIARLAEREADSEVRRQVMRRL